MVSNVDLTKQELVRHFEKWFPGCRTELDAVPMSEKFGGFLIWNGFAGQMQTERQAALWGHLRTLPRQDQRQITAIFTVTEEELQSMREEE